MNSDPSGQARFAEHYEILSEIGRGGMGVVYKARQRSTGVLVVVKRLIQTKRNDEQLARFQREAVALAQFRHPNIIGIHDYGMENGEPYFVMPFIEGHDLKTLINARLRESSTGLESARLLDIFEQVALALSACHDRGLIHRDIKPANILIESSTNRAFLADFGLVRQTDKDIKNALLSHTPSLTNSGQWLGTPSFMSPEQLDPEEFGELGPPSDVWGFGATLLYAMSGQTPYDNQSITLLYGGLSAGEPKDIEVKCQNYPPYLVDICRACLTRDSSLRPDIKVVHGALKTKTLPSSFRRRRPYLPLLGLALPLISILLWVTLIKDNSPPHLLIASLPERVAVERLP
ncbi:MAG: serine/threonine-protein kinase, partial [Planctomycetota bacterium]|nr:serine/threonine-protein kinase [Planctomycetota bacterium]